MYDPNSSMLPSPNRGKRRTNTASPRLPHSMQQGNNFNSPRFSRAPDRFQPYHGSGNRGYQQDSRQFTPRYRSMNGAYEGSSPNCSYEDMKHRKFNSGNILFHPSMFADPWKDISSDAKPIFKAANYVSESFMSYCTKLQLKVRNSERSIILGSESTSTANIKSEMQKAPCKSPESHYSPDDKALQTVKPSQQSELVEKDETSVPQSDHDSGNKVRDSGGSEDDESDDDDGNIMF